MVLSNWSLSAESSDRKALRTFLTNSPIEAISIKFMRVFLLSHRQQSSKDIENIGFSFPFPRSLCSAFRFFFFLSVVVVVDVLRVRTFVCAMEITRRQKNVSLFFLTLHRMTWMIKRLYFYMPSRSIHWRVPSRDIHIKNSFVKCDRELMAFLLMNHRMEIEFRVWKGLAFIS